MILSIWRPFPCRTDLLKMLFPINSSHSISIYLEIHLHHFFQAIGYPHKKNTKAVNRTARIPGEFRSEGIRYTVTDISSCSFPYKNFCESFHIATCLTKTGEIQGVRTHANIPDLHGISGGLLQIVSNYNPTTDGFDIAYPAGIILEKKSDNSAFSHCA